MILQHLQHRGTKAYILQEEDLQQMQRSLLDINNLLTIAYKELLEENEVLRRQLEQARTFRQTGCGEHSSDRLKDAGTSPMPHA